MSQPLTYEDRQRLYRRFEQMKPEARVQHIAALRNGGGHAEKVSILEGMHYKITLAEKAAATPLEIAGQPQTRPASRRRPDESDIMAPAPNYGAVIQYWPHALIGSAALAAGYMAIPIFIATVSAVVATFSAVVATIAALVVPVGVVALLVGFLFMTLSGGSGEKKSSGGERIINIHIHADNGDKITVNQ